MCSYRTTLQGHLSLSQLQADLHQLHTFPASPLERFTGGFGNSRIPGDPPSPLLGGALECGISLQGGNCRCALVVPGGSIVMGRWGREHPDSGGPC